jgi:hypothetical protein
LTAPQPAEGKSGSAREHVSEAVCRCDTRNTWEADNNANEPEDYTAMIMALAKNRRRIIIR